MTSSVCMCTYNGEKYILEQLESIYRQTCRPEEVIFCDDISKDRTVIIIEEFIKTHQLEDQWHLFVNTENLGYLANFYHACGLCKGDIIFFADQDDVWHPRKLEKMIEIFEDKKDAKAVCCKFGLISAKGEKLSGLTAPVHTGESGSLRRLSIEDIFHKFECPAMVLSFRRDWYLSWQMQTKSSEIPHDYLVCAKAAEEGGLFQIDLELASHRLHEENVAKEEHRLKVLLNKKRKLEEIEDYMFLLDAFQREQPLQTEEGKRVLQNKRQIMLDRRKALESGKLLQVLQFRKKYGGKEIRMATFLCDLWIVKQKEKKA